MIDSPYLLLQEIYREHPWRMLVCCIMLNCTSRKQVDQIREQFFNTWPTPNSAMEADESKMQETIALLGFKAKRTKTIIRFSREFLEKSWSEPKELHGIGKYGQDSWEIFQKYNLDVLPTDSVLVTYLNWAKQLQS
jgi:methyl-CpG-binding domain protein 4